MFEDRQERGQQAIRTVLGQFPDLTQDQKNQLAEIVLGYVHMSQTALEEARPMLDTLCRTPRTPIDQAVAWTLGWEPDPQSGVWNPRQ